jgi:hypothetical protein
MDGAAEPESAGHAYITCHLRQAGYLQTDYYVCSVFDIALARAAAPHCWLDVIAGADMADLFSFQ